MIPVGKKLVLFALVAGAAALLAPSAWAADRLQVGQIWTLADGAYPTVRVIISRKEPSAAGPVIHVSLLDVPVPTLTGETTLTPFGHMPFTEEAVERSVGEQVGATEHLYARFEEGYAEWKKDRGGVFTITIPEAIKLSILTMLTGTAR